MDMNLDLKLLDKALDRVKTKVKLSDPASLDDEQLLIQREQEAKATAENIKLNAQVKREVAELDLKIFNDLQEISGLYTDEVSLLC